MLRLPPLKRSFNKGLWAVTDQGLFGGSNFLLNIMLARWLTPREYGAFTVAFTIFLWIGIFHTALLTEPMLVFGPGKYRNRLPEYLGILVSGHSSLVAIGSLLLMLAGAVFWLWGVTTVSSALATLALTAPFILLLWLMRRACYLHLAPNLAASGGLVNVVLTGSGLIVLYQHRWLSTASVLAVMGFVSLVTSAWLAVLLHVGRPPVTVNAFVRETAADHWGYGRWAAATMAVTYLPGSIYYMLLSVWHGLEASAALKAMMNLILPALNLNAALSTLLVPALVRAREQEKHRRDFMNLILVLLTAGGVGYWVLLTVFRHPLMIWLYRGQYAESEGVEILLLVILIASGVVTVLGSALRALERPDHVFRANLHSAAVALAVGLWGTFRWGVWGAGAGLALESTVRALATARAYGKFSRPALAGPPSAGPIRVDEWHPAMSRLMALVSRTWR